MARQVEGGRRIEEAATQFADGLRRTSRRRGVQELLLVQERDIRRPGGWRGSIEAELGTVRSRRERAIGGAKRVVVLCVEDGEDVEAVARDIAEPSRHRAARTLGAPRPRAAVAARERDAAEVLPCHEVDDAGDRIAAVERRGSVLQNLDPVDGSERNDVQVDAWAAGAGEGIVGQASAVQQHQRLPGSQAAQRRAREDRACRRCRGRALRESRRNWR